MLSNISTVSLRNPNFISRNEQSSQSEQYKEYEEYSKQDHPWSDPPKITASMEAIASKIIRNNEDTLLFIESIEGPTVE